MSNELFGEVVKTISLDFAQKTSPVTVFAKQGDNRTRIIHIQPLMNGVPMNIDTSFQYVAKFAAKKPDGHYVYNDSAKINDDGTITVTLTDQTLAAHGNAICCIMLETQSGDVLSSQNFTLIIEFSAGAYQNLASSDEIMGLDDKLAQVQELIDKLNAEIKVLPPITPEDKDKVLTANEDGTAAWKDPKGGLSVTEITSPEEITADSPDGLYIQEGGSSGGNGGGTTIHYYDSLGEVPADLPEGSFVAVPAEGKVFDLTAMGMPVIEQIGQDYFVPTETTEVYEKFLSGNVDFSFDFMMSGNKVVVHARTISVPMVGVCSCSTIVVSVDGDTPLWIAAYISATEQAVQISTKLLA
jgi:hypothetical protein